MGNAYLWWYPTTTSTLESIDLGPSLTDLEETPDPLIEAVESLSGAQARVTYRGRYRVRIVLERIAGTSTTGRALMRSLWSLQTHLDGGGAVAFARDRDLAWAGFTFPSPARGDATIQCVGAAVGGVFPFYASATLSAGADIVIQACAPETHRREMLLASSISSVSTITLDTQTVRHDWTGMAAMVRHRDFYPLLRQPLDRVGEAIVLSERRIGYTLDLHLVEDADGIEAIRLNGAGSMSTDGSRNSLTLAGAIAQAQSVTRGVTASGGQSGRGA